MSEDRPQRIYREFTPQERARWEKARDEALALRPQVIEKGRRLREAAQEPTFSGSLRTAVHKHRKPLEVIATEAGIPVVQLDEFLTGERTLRNDLIDRLIQVLGFQFPTQPASLSPKLIVPEFPQSESQIIDPASLSVPGSASKP